MDDLKARISQTSPEVVASLEAGQTPAGLDAPALVAAIARVGLGDEASGGPGLVQKPPAQPKLIASLTEPAMAAMFPHADRPSRLALAAGLLQILDAWDLSHASAQEADDLGERSTAAYWHLIAHRREPDAGNALYWARRVGPHPIHGPLADEARSILAGQADRLLPGGVWSAPAMIDLTARARPGTPDEALARTLQRCEMIALLAASLSATGSR